MKTYEVFTSMSGNAELWSDDTYTLHFGAGFDDECESTPEMLWEAVSADSLKFIAACGASANDRGKALAALAEGLDRGSITQAEYDLLTDRD